ncbi:hypothetical protein [Sporosarcina highlanderae]|uniref:Uncharacterized protein n=1 Tax=Sporosarcina highlanderae TaxID=3035916 RepID=A0ABT8JVW5_9BACL|nr:hypothetical protein [Sporosarcina highlanderae]MDN4609229.1 hypothetical protein [Sporosarcina highlanderae]
MKNAILMNGTEQAKNMNGVDKMTNIIEVDFTEDNKKNTIGTQIEFMVLSFLSQDLKAVREGVRLERILAGLEENQKLWESRGEGSKWEDRIAWTLSNLYKQKKIGKVKGVRDFLWDPNNSEAALKAIVETLTTNLELNIEFGFDGLSLSKSEQMDRILDGSAEIEITSKSQGFDGQMKVRSILTAENMTQLALLAVKHDLYE